MPRTDRYLLLLGVIGIVLSIGIGYQYAMTTLNHPPAKTCLAVPPSRLQDTALLSVVPNLKMAAQRQILLPIDLRRADLQMTPDLASSPQALPVLDKVLFVPKKFG